MVRREEGIRIYPSPRWGGEDVFIHYSNIQSDDDFKTLQSGQRVQFELNDGPKGLHALKVTAMGEKSAGEDDSPGLSGKIDPTDVDPTAEVDPLGFDDESSEPAL